MRLTKAMAAEGEAKSAAPADWKASLPEDIRGDESIASFKDAGELAQAYRETRKTHIRIPGDDAGDDVKAAFREQLRAKVPSLVELPADDAELEKVEEGIFARFGRKKDAKDYQLPKDMKTPEGFILAPIAAQAAEFGLTRRQFEALAKKSMETVEKERTATVEADAELRKELGQAYDERVAAARATAQKFGIPEDVAKLLPPGQIRTWLQVAKAVAPEMLNVAGQGGSAGALTPAEALAQAAEIRANPDFHDPKSPRQPHLERRHTELMRIAYS